MSDYKIVDWSESLDLSYFYQKSKEKGFINNSSYDTMIKPLLNEKEWKVWILFKKGKAIGSVAAHSFDFMGKNSYRIGVRSCVHSEDTEIKNLRTKYGIKYHQNATAQFLIPICIEWAPKGSNLYITTHDSSEASLKLMHNICMPIFQSTGMVEKVCEKEYRGHKQTFWKVNPDIFFQQLNENPRW